MTSDSALANEVGELLGARVVAHSRVSGGDINDAYRMQLDNDVTVFVKSQTPPPPDLFTTEASGLSWLAETKTVRVPSVLAVSDHFLVLEWVEPGPPGADHDDQLGRALAELHRSPCESFGLDHDNYLATIPQSNTPCATWAEFYATRRLEPLMQIAIDNERLPASAVDAFDRLFARLDQLVGPIEPPSHLHGDLWAGNAMADARGRPWLFDPAVYGGHREIDLAMMRLFGGFSSRVFDAYNEVHPVADGYDERVSLYQLYPLLTHVILFGGGYATSLMSAMKRYA